MTRRRRSYRGEGEEGLGVKIAVGFGLLALLAVAGIIGFFFISEKRAAASLDPETFCPNEGPTSITSVLIDRTDGINETQAAALRNFFDTWRDAVPEYGAFRVYEVAGGVDLPEPVLSVCNPGDVENVSVFTGNERLTRQRYDAKFKRPIDALLAGMLTDKASDASPIMEAVQAMAIRDFARASDRELIIVSDLLQHTQQFSLYKQPPDVAGFRNSVYGQKVEADLRGVKTRVYLIHSASPRQTGDVVQFWLDWLMLQGADLQGQFKVPG
jgi:hypothetical protein